MFRIIRLFLIAFTLAFIGSVGSVIAAAAQLLLFVPIVAYKRSATENNLNFRIWFLGTALFVVSVLLCAPFADEWDTIGLMLFCPVFGLLVVGLDALILHCLSYRHQQIRKAKKAPGD